MHKNENEDEAVAAWRGIALAVVGTVVLMAVFWGMLHLILETRADRDSWPFYPFDPRWP